MEPKFMISDVLGTSWRCTKEQIWVLVGLLIGYFILSSILSMFAMPVQSTMVSLIVINVINILLSCLFSLGYVKNIFQALDGEEPQFSAYGQQSRKIFTFLIASIITTLIVFISLCILIIPGIYIGLRLQFFIAFIVEEDAGILDSLKRSWKITEGQVIPLFLLSLTLIGLFILGFIVLFVGIFVATPLIYTMYCEVFRKLNTLSAGDTIPTM